MKYTIGIDLGGTTMTAGLVDEAYNIVLLPKTARLILQMSAMWASVPRAV